MGFLDRLFSWNGDAAPIVARPGDRPAALQWRATDDPDLSAYLGGRESRVGRSISERQALSNPAMFRAYSLIVGTIGQLPLNLMMRGADGAVAKADGHPVQLLLRRSPNPMRRQAPGEFKGYMQGRALLKGNAFAHIVPGVRGPQALIQLDPDRVRIEQRDDWSLEYLWQPAHGSERRFKQEEMFHLRAPWSSDGLLGDGLLKMGAELLEQADAANEITSRMLGNGTHAGGKVKVDKKLSEEAALRLKGQFEDIASGPRNAGRWLVLEEGADAEPFEATGRDGEGVAQLKLLIESIARLTGVPRPLMMMDETSWGSGIEALGLFFITYCLLPWFNAWEEAIARSLLTERERETHFAKFNEAALLRGSLKDQAEFLSKMLGGPGTTPAMVPNEAREKMELPPIDGGDRPNWGQMDNGDSNGTT